MSVSAAHTSTSPLLLATDLDGTFAGGEEQDRLRLYRTLVERPARSLCYITGRYLQSARTLQAVFHLPEPDLWVTDVGASVTPAESHEGWAALHTELLERWPGADRIRTRLTGVAAVLESQGIPTDRRLSYFVKDGHRLDEVLPVVRDALTDLDVEVIGSAGVYVDILPGGVNKGSTLRKVVALLDADPASVVVAGDSLNDLALFDAGFKGIVVGNAEEPLKQAARRMEQVYCARGYGARGVAEGLRHFGFLSSEEVTDE